MHRLDGYINDLEPRIRAICKHAPEQEESSLQESLSSYGWVLLDSWIAWRTLRYLLKTTHIDDKVNEKWFSTPSSYTASQLKAIWGFEDSALRVIKTKTDKNLKELIDQGIQSKRNAAAHFSKRTIVKGNDYQEIKQYFDVLSKIFLLYETASFIDSICNKFEKHEYAGFTIEYPGIEAYNLEENRKTGFVETIDRYFTCEGFILQFSNKQKECRIHFLKEGCETETIDLITGIRRLRNLVISSSQEYRFFENKGFYLEVDAFVNRVIKNINDE